MLLNEVGRLPVSVSAAWPDVTWGGLSHPLGVAMNRDELIFDWNTSDAPTPPWAKPVLLDDETLRDGLQSPSIVDPPIGQKIRLLHLMDGLGIDTADIGLPGAGPRAVKDVTALCEEIASSKLRLRPNCAARTLMVDIQPIADIAQATGVPIEICCFIGSSPIRFFTEGWSMDRMLARAEEAVSFAVSEGLAVTFVTEDTTRAKPETLKLLYGKAIEWGAKRLCLSDTVGHSTPEGARSLVRFVLNDIVEPSGEDIGVDWHGHRDRGLGLANALAAIESGATRIHGTALGVGERVGNVEMDQLLINLALAGVHDADMTLLPEYCTLASEALGVPLPYCYPVVGADAFRTATGVHAAAIIKAERRGDPWLADRVYSGVPASLVGRQQEIEISPMSGISNVRYWLEKRGMDPEDETLCQHIFTAAKTGDHTLSETEILALVKECRPE